MPLMISRFTVPPRRPGGAAGVAAACCAAWLALAAPVAAQPASCADWKTLFTSGDAADVKRCLATFEDVNVALLEAILRAASPAIVSVLLDAGADATATPTLYPPPFDESTLLHVAVQMDYRRDSPDAGSHSQSPQNRELLARRGNAPGNVAALLNAGADVNAAGNRGRTPLHEAVEGHSSPDTVAVLVAAGADPNARDNLGNTPLHDVWLSSPPWVIAALLDAGADPNAVNDRGRTPLHIMLLHDAPLESVAALLAGGADPHLPTPSTGFLRPPSVRGAPPLHLAAVRSSPKVIAALVDAGADLEARNKYGKTALHVAASWDLRHENVEALLDAGADREQVTACENWNTRAFFAVADEDEVARCLASGLDLKAHSGNGARPLHMAAAAGSASIVGVLLEAGAEVQARTDDRETALHWAARWSTSPEVVATLVAAGADVHAETAEGKTVLQLAVSRSGQVIAALLAGGAGSEVRGDRGRALMGELHERAPYIDPGVITVLAGAGVDLNVTLDNGKETLLHRVVQSETPRPALVSALLDGRADVNARTARGATPLNLALSSDDPETILMLIKAGADLEAPGGDGRTPLSMAVQTSLAHKAIPLLLDAGANPNVRDRNGDTPLLQALKVWKHGDPDSLVVRLLQAGADATQTAEDGKTPLHIAIESNRGPAVIAALLQGGAAPNVVLDGGMTLLHTAAALSVTPAVIDALLDGGADGKAQDGAGLTAFDIAKGNPALKGSDAYWRLNDARF